MLNENENLLCFKVEPLIAPNPHIEIKVIRLVTRSGWKIFCQVAGTTRLLKIQANAKVERKRGRLRGVLPGI